MKGNLASDYRVDYLSGRELAMGPDPAAQWGSTGTYLVHKYLLTQRPTFSVKCLKLLPVRTRLFLGPVLGKFIICWLKDRLIPSELGNGVRLR